MRSINCSNIPSLIPDPCPIREVFVYDILQK